MRVLYTLPALLLILAGCGEDAGPSAEAEPTEAVTTTTASSDSETIAEPTGVLPLADGYLEPGRYRHVVSMDWCKDVKNDPIACPTDVPLPPDIPVVVTVPSDRWFGSPEFHLIEPLDVGTEAPDGAALVIGWTSHSVGVQSDPCLSKNHQTPDVKVGLSVDDFVDAVTAQDWFEFAAPVKTKIGGAPGKYFTLTGPADLSKCEEWRPWDPGFYAQGPGNIWEVWALDVRGHRVLIVINYYKSTPQGRVDELHQMVDSIRFPSK